MNIDRRTIPARSVSTISPPGLRSLAGALPLLAALAACSGDGADNNSSGSGSGSGSGGGGDGGAGTATSTGAGGTGGLTDECPAGSHLGASGVCEATLAEWATGPLLLGARDHHATFIAEVESGAFLYVLGGVRDMSTALSSVESARIHDDDGSLDAWAAGSNLPEAMIGHSVATVGKTVVVTAGIRLGVSGSELSAKTEVTAVKPDGSLAPWIEGPELSASRFHHAMAAHEGWVYVVGGLTGDGKDNTTLVERAAVGPDGKLGAWEAVTPLPDKRSHHGRVAAGGALYVTAGLKGDPANAPQTYKDVLRAVIGEGGALGEWTVVSELPVPLATHSSFVYLDHIYVAGGVEKNSANTNHVRRALMSKDGSLGAWEDVTLLPKKRAHTHQTPVFGRFVYSAGGAFMHESISDVFIGRFE